jgi:regulation of enolase protein 1 (concanavalin A-like superfamily)
MKLKVYRSCAFLILVMGAAGIAPAEEPPSLDGIPGPLVWKNAPAEWRIERGRTLTITSGPKTDWFVDPFDGKVASTAPMLLFSPAEDFVLSARVSVRFRSKWDAGALMVWADDHHWVKLAFELSPAGKPLLVTVVTRGASDDANALPVSGRSVFLQIARTGPTYVLSSSSNARDWNVLRTFRLETDAAVQVGFEAQSPDGSGCEASFTEIRYAPKKVKNIYKEE